MKPKKSQKKVRLFALALSAYFAAFFLSTPNVISEERYGAHLTSKIMIPEEEAPSGIVLSEEDVCEKEETSPSKPKKPIKDTAEDKKEEISTEKEEDKKDPSAPKPETLPPADVPEAESPENPGEDESITPPSEESPSLPEQDEDEPSEEVLPEETPSEKEENIMSVVATAYCGCYDCNGKWTGYPAADGSPLKSYHTIAADSSIPFGTKVYIPFFASSPNGGYFEVEDRGSAIVGNRIDIYFSSHSEALAFGMRELKMHVLG